MKKLFHNPSAFTLIELLVVIVVISILAGITLPVAKYVSFRARQAQQKIYIEKIKSALEDYRAAYGEYPITPRFVTNEGVVSVGNPGDVVRHYEGNSGVRGVEWTECYYTTNSPYITNDFIDSNGTIETIVTEEGTRFVDYCLTYPLMMKQIDSGSRPFMDFKKATVAHLVYNPNLAQDKFQIKRRRQTAAGNVVERVYDAIYGNKVQRYKAVDPVTQKQWLYSSFDGVTYTLTNNPSY